MSLLRSRHYHVMKLGTSCLQSVLEVASMHRRVSGSQNQSECFGGEKNLLLVPGIDIQCIGLPIHRLVTKSTTLFQLPSRKWKELESCIYKYWKGNQQNHPLYITK